MSDVRKKHNFDLLSCQLSDLVIFTFSAAGFVVPLAMMFSPKFEPRVTVIAMHFALVASTMAISKLKNFPAPIKNFLPTVATIICVILATSTIAEFYLLSSQIREQEKFIIENRTAEIIELAPLKSVPEFVLKITGWDSNLLNYFGGISNDPNFYFNLMVAEYYGAKKIVAR